MSDFVKWWVNGVQTDLVSVADRGLAYGDGLFETMRAVGFKIPLLEPHLSRLMHGSDLLALNVSRSAVEQMLAEALAWIEEQGGSQALIKLIATRAGESRGYRPDASLSANVYLRAGELATAEPPPLLRVKICDHRLPAWNGLSGLKHLNRLDQVMASRELGPDLDEGLLLDDEGCLVEGISNNLFLVFDSEIVTPSLPGSGVRGVMREFCMQQISTLPDFSIVEKSVSLAEIKKADEILVCNAVRGVRNIGEIEDIWRCSGLQVGDRLRALIKARLGAKFSSF